MRRANLTASLARNPGTLAPRHFNRASRGMASLLAMLFLVLFSAMAIGFFAEVTSSAQVAVSGRRVSEAQVAAESGIAFIRYHLSALSIARDNPDRMMEEISQQLSDRLNGTENLGGASGAVGYDDVKLRIEIPAGANNYVRTPNGSGFKVFIDMNTDRTLRLSAVGRYGSVTSGLGRGIQVTFKPAQLAAPLLGYGVAGRGPVSVQGNGTIRGVPDPTYGSLLITSTTNPALTMTGPSEISGDIYLTNSAATTSVAANCSIGGTTDPVLRAGHIHKLSGAPPEFPVIDTELFRPYATTTWTAATGLTVRNCIVRANTNPSFASGTNILGVLYVETPNILTFSGTCTLRGVIASQTPPTGSLATNVLRFSGQATAFDASTLDASFGDVRTFTGSSIVCPGFDVQFSGGYAAISGTIVSSKLTFSGTAGGNISGSVIGLGNQVLTITGSSQVFLERPATAQWPAGVYFRSKYVPGSDSYLEKSADALQFVP
jgi:hypothetical protein